MLRPISYEAFPRQSDLTRDGLRQEYFGTHPVCSTTRRGRVESRIFPDLFHYTLYSEGRPKHYRQLFDRIGHRKAFSPSTSRLYSRRLRQHLGEIGFYHRIRMGLLAPESVDISVALLGVVAPFCSLYIESCQQNQSLSLIAWLPGGGYSIFDDLRTSTRKTLAALQRPMLQAVVVDCRCRQILQLCEDRLRNA
jgi:hypothetical protein